MSSLCGAAYGKNNNCNGCEASNRCPFGKPCFIAQYIKQGGMEYFKRFRQQLVDKFNALNVPGMPKTDELFAGQ